MADGLFSVIDRINEEGDIPHKEETGEAAAFFHRQAGTSDDGSFRKFTMVDTAFLLPIVLANFLESRGPAATNRLLVRKSPRQGRTLGELVQRNLHFVLRLAKPFAENPIYQNLIHFQPGAVSGNWRAVGGFGIAGSPWAGFS